MSLIQNIDVNYAKVHHDDYEYWYSERCLERPQ